MINANIITLPRKKEEVFELKCDYADNFIPVSMPDRTWHKQTKCWRGSITRLNVEYLRSCRNKLTGSDEFWKVLNYYKPEVSKRGPSFSNQYPFKLKPFPHQLEGLKKLYPFNKSALLMDIGTGKTKVAIDTATCRFYEGLISKVLVIALVSIKDNWSREINKNSPVPTTNHILQTTKAGQKRYNKFLEEDGFQWLIVGVESFSAGKAFDLCQRFVDDKTMIIIDECFTPDIEILTENGFIRFDKLTKKEKIAQYNPNNEAISFAKPLRYVKNNYNGKMYNIQGEYGCDITITPNHDLLINRPYPLSQKNINQKDMVYKHRKIKPDKYKPRYKDYFIKAGKAEGNNCLCNIERLYIAIQADGYIMKSGLIRFMLSKKRKQERLEFLLKKCNIEWYYTKERKIFKLNLKANPAKVYCFHPPFKATKNLWDWFSLINISYKKAISIIEEMVLWDGSINKRIDNNYKFNSTSRNQADFYQCVATLANYRSLLRCDKGKEDNHNDLYRVSINKNRNKAECQRIFKSEIDYKGKIFCVTMPEGYIIVRKNGKVVITGNSDSIKNDGAIRTERCIQLGKLVKYSMIMTGTPITQGMIDLYSQFEFLDSDIIGIGSFYAFRNRYAVMGGHENKNIIGYQRVDELIEAVSPFIFQVRKRDVLRDLPPATYQERVVQMSAEQKKIYGKLKNQLRMVYNDRTLTVKNTINLMQRFSEITGGFYSYVDEEEMNIIPIEEKAKIKYKKEYLKSNPKAKELLQLISTMNEEEPVIIWAVSKMEVAYITSELVKIYGEDAVVEMHGGVSREQRTKNLDKFQSGKARFLTGNQSVGGIGLNMTISATMIYFSNNFSLKNRIQSEGRIERIGQTRAMTYIDLVCAGSIDKYILKALKNKLDFSEVVRAAFDSGELEGLI